MIDYGYVTSCVGEVIKQRGFSKNKVEALTGIKRSQLNRYCNDDVSRIDFHTIAKLCCVLDCDINDLLHYEKAKKE